MADRAAAAIPIVSTEKSRKHRSPSYPGIDLATAIGRAETFYKHERRNPASLPVVVGHWNYKPTSSGALIAVAALKSFGLLVEHEAGPGGRILQLTDLALRIILDQRPGSSEREAAIKQSALTPKIYADLWRRYNGTLPSIGEIRHRLIFDYNFNENSIDDFIKKFQQTIAFAKLAESDTISTEQGDSEPQSDAGPSALKVGDYVQWESQGVLQFETPKRVRAFSDDGRFAFVEGGATGLPINELTANEPPASELPALPRVYTMADAIKLNASAAAPTLPVLNARQELFSLAEGAVSLRWPASLSKESFEDVSEWLDIVKRKISRCVKPCPSDREI